jgi:hypothetical protein
MARARTPARTRARIVAALAAAASVAAVTAAPAAWADDTVTPLCNGQQCVTTPGYWYGGPVTLSWGLSAGGTGPTCGQIYFAADTAGGSSSCTATFTDSTTITRSAAVNVELSTPTAAATLARGPDAFGWYNHPVTVSFAGSAFSGIAACTAPVTYAGPDTGQATISGSCTDNAGKVATAAVTFAYDATAPGLLLAADSADRVAGLRWATSDAAPLASVTIVRTRRHGRARRWTLGPDITTFTDTSVSDRVRYRYTVTITDLAGNASSKSIVVTPAPRLLAPGSRALVSAAPALSWTPVRGATYYNVQLWRGSTKVLSTWPTRPQLQLRRAWRRDGRRYRLRPGRYRWYVWPGFGRRQRARYGHEIGSRVFTVAAG